MNAQRLVEPSFVAALALAYCVGSFACKAKDEEAQSAPPASAAETSAPVSNQVNAPPTGAPDPCVAACARSRELHCPGAKECETTCAALRDSDPCGAEMRAALGCFVGQPATSWECGEDGMAAIREGFCVAAQQRVVDCLSAAGAH